MQQLWDVWLGLVDTVSARWPRGLSALLRSTALTGLLASLGVLSWLWSWRLASTPVAQVCAAQSEPFIAEPTTTPEVTTLLDISGAVKKPGVYRLRPDSLVADAIATAGGLRADANHRLIAQEINLAETVKLGTKLYLPFQDEALECTHSSLTTPVSAAVVEPAADQLISFNDATQAELESLPGIGASRANKLIEGRPYQSVDEPYERGILTQTVWDNIKDRVEL